MSRGQDQTNTLHGVISSIVLEETLFLRHYVGRVLNNLSSERDGWVLVEIPELGWTGESEAAWCAPRYMHGISVPKVNEYVEVYFIGGDQDRPVYLTIAQEMQGMIPTNFDGLPENHVLFESPTTTDFIKYNDNSKQFDFQFSLMNLGIGATEAAVLGTALNTYLTDFINNVFNTHTHVCAGPGSPSAVPSPTGTAPSGILSTKIKVS